MNNTVKNIVNLTGIPVVVAGHYFPSSMVANIVDPLLNVEAEEIHILIQNQTVDGPAMVESVIPVNYVPTYHNVTNLPEPNDSTKYIVSREVAMLLSKYRKDLYIFGNLVDNASTGIKQCDYLLRL